MTKTAVEGSEGGREQEARRKEEMRGTKKVKGLPQREQRSRGGHREEGKSKDF